MSKTFSLSQMSRGQACLGYAMARKRLYLYEHIDERRKDPNYIKKMYKTFFLTITSLLASVTMSFAQTTLPPLKVSGRNLVDDNGQAVVLHGVMDTPNRYFNSWRWQGLKISYGLEDVVPCIEYFDKIFTAITDHEQGAYCTVFRLHLDPCWTNDPNKPLIGEGG